uniref:transcriptional repressor ILP1 isoform X1 n=1 Tax=Erigeron canadensis TaxID=72917 RepID=UPI001CB917DB|nr:transcriptional repressor ILP1 isoform X1 [Erigeron canadensis]XP_043624494.1 transcriptional repressor ILP1 isoform X2 [Erigeron canadensis]XP_043624496.1 transcriptional repressor ILP1 isoform X3 [Erigeron canadensis]
MSSAKSRNFRRRSDETNDDDDDNKPTQSKQPPQSKPTQKPKKQNLLSFADDEEEQDSLKITPKNPNKPTTKPTKTPSFSSSHKLTSSKDRKTTKTSSFSTPLPSNVTPQAGTYTKEALLELQKNTKSLSGSRPNTRPSQPDPVFVLKGLDSLKPNSSIKSSLKNLDKNNVGVSNKNVDDEGSSDDGDMDQKYIDEIRAKRERLRQSRAAAPDFISLDGGSNHGEAEGLSDEEPEFTTRIAMIGDVKKGVFEDSKENDDIEVYDEEDKLWEEEQVRKGLGIRRDEGGVVSVNGGVTGSTGQKFVNSSGSTNVFTYPSIGGMSIGGSSGLSSGSESVSIAQQAEISKKALRESLARLKETHGRTLASLTKTDENLSDSLLKVMDLETALTAAGEKFIFMQKLRDYVSTVCDFLQDKAPFIEELEYQMQQLHKEHAEAIMERRQADSNDELIEIEASVNAAKAILNKGGATSSMVEAASIAAQAALTASRESKNLPAKLDEFGRDVNLQKRMDMKRRAESRQRRKARSESKRISSMEIDNFVEGESSTDESDSESTAYESNRDQLLQTAGQIFSDADEEFSQLSAVKEIFEVWKKDYSSSYSDAYMSLSIPAIFSPYVRLELLKWDPLHDDSDFIDMQWHELLFNYGLPEDESNVDPNDADVNLIPDLVEKVAIPILQYEIAHCWDMLSTKETKYAVAATSLVFRYVPLSSKAVSELVAVLRDRLSAAVANLMVPTWNTLVLRSVPSAARFAAYRFGMSVRLMRNICLWNKILSMSILEKIALDELLSGKIIPHLRSIQSNIHDAITRTERIVASISGVWAGQSVTERSPRLQPLVDYLLVLGKTLEKRQSSSEANELARRLKKMLVELNEYDHARHISRTFNLKEAL